jgi:glutamate synthase domain-containing protein 2
MDYVILDGRGGGTGAAPLLFRDHISVPTMPALARARAHLDRRGRRDVTLVITGGLRHAPDFAKALALGADAVAVANSAIQAIGCLGMRACNTNHCPVGIATQKPHLRARLPVDEAAHRLDRFLRRSTASSRTSPASRTAGAWRPDGRSARPSSRCRDGRSLRDCSPPLVPRSGSGVPR